MSDGAKKFVLPEFGAGKKLVAGSVVAYNALIDSLLPAIEAGTGLLPVLTEIVARYYSTELFRSTSGPYPSRVFGFVPGAGVPNRDEPYTAMVGGSKYFSRHNQLRFEREAKCYTVFAREPLLPAHASAGAAAGTAARRRWCFELCVKSRFGNAGWFGVMYKPAGFSGDMIETKAPPTRHAGAYSYFTRAAPGSDAKLGPVTLTGEFDVPMPRKEEMHVRRALIDAGHAKVAKCNTGRLGGAPSVLDVARTGAAGWGVDDVVHMIVDMRTTASAGERKTTTSLQFIRNGKLQFGNEPLIVLPPPPRSDSRSPDELWVWTTLLDIADATTLHGIELL